MINDKFALKKCLSHEKKFYQPTFLGQIAAFFGFSEKNIIWKYQKHLRKWEFYLNKKCRVLTAYHKMKCTKMGFKYGFSISPNSIDEGLRIMHLGHILINSNARIGKNVVLHSGVCIVATGGISEAAKIGNNCKLGVNCILIGNIEIGDNSVVGAGAVVTKSFIEGHVTLAGVPAKVVSNKAVL